MNSIDELARKFKEWRGSRRQCRFPKAFWDDIRQLSTHHTLKIISKKFGISEQYIRRKLKNPQQVKFAQVKVASQPSAVTIEFSDNNLRPMTVRFQANHDELVRVILTLTAC